jgi:hypothetical protein
MSEVQNIIYNSIKNNNTSIKNNNTLNDNCDYEEEQLFNLENIIFDKNNKQDKILVGFQGFNCDVKLSLGGHIIKCFDHIISCNLRYSHIHDIKLIVEPKNNLENYHVTIFWSNNDHYTQFITDETMDEIIETVVYSYCGVGVIYEFHNEINMIKKIIKKLSNKTFVR